MGVKGKLRLGKVRSARLEAMLEADLVLRRAAEKKSKEIHSWNDRRKIRIG